MIQFDPNFCYCAVYQETSFLKGNGPFLARLPFSGLEVSRGPPGGLGASKGLQGWGTLF